MNFPRLGYGHPGHLVGTYFNHPTIVNENISKRTQGRGPGTLKQSQRVEWSFHLNPWNLLGKTFSFLFLDGLFSGATLPETNISSYPLKIDPGKGDSYWRPLLLGSTLVLGSVYYPVIWGSLYKPLDHDKDPY